MSRNIDLYFINSNYINVTCVVLFKYFSGDFECIYYVKLDVVFCFVIWILPPTVLYWPIWFWERNILFI